MYYILLSVFVGVSLFAVLALVFVWFRRPAWILQSLIWLVFLLSSLQLKILSDILFEIIIIYSFK